MVADTIREADWVVGVPSPAGDNEMVFFELGIASALGKRCVNSERELAIAATPAC